MADEAKKPKLITAPTIGTHNGTFHCDEVKSSLVPAFLTSFKIFICSKALACYLLSKHPDFQKHHILRTRDQALLDECDIVVDVGAVFDHSKKRYDHHQREFKETFDSLRPELETKCDIK